jgi:hypothetical protein
MITIQIVDQETGVSACAEFPSEYGPTLRSTIQEWRNEVGERSAGAHLYDKEDALTRANIILGSLAAAVNRVIPREDPHYE